MTTNSKPLPADVDRMRAILNEIVLKPDALYIGDGGRCYCGNCSGFSAKYTGRDLSGQKVYRVTKKDAQQAIRDGWKLSCESCGKEIA